MAEREGGAIESGRANVLERIVDRFDGFFYRCKADRTFTMVYLSNGIERILGYPPDLFVGVAARPYRSLALDEDIAAVRPAIEAAIAARRTWNVDYRMVAQDGRHVWMNEVATGVFDSEGQLVHFEGALTVVEEKKRIEAEREAVVGAVASASADIVSSTRAIFEMLGNLKTLALNARIEAARAGDAGAGFSVVAQEINALANEAGEVAARIDASTEDMRRVFAAVRG